jgi:hypothetical protein
MFMLECKNKKAMDLNGKTLKNQSRQIIINVQGTIGMFPDCYRCNGLVKDDERGGHTSTNLLHHTAL